MCEYLVPDTTHQIGATLCIGLVVRDLVRGEHLFGLATPSGTCTVTEGDRLIWMPSAIKPNRECSHEPSSLNIVRWQQTVLDTSGDVIQYVVTFIILLLDSRVPKSCLIVACGSWTGEASGLVIRFTSCADFDSRMGRASVALWRDSLNLFPHRAYRFAFSVARVAAFVSRLPRGWSLGPCALVALAV